MQLIFWVITLFAAGIILVLHHFLWLVYLPYFVSMAVLIGIPLYRLLDDSHELRKLYAIATVTMVIYLLYIGHYLGGIKRRGNIELYDHPLIFFYWCPVFLYVIISIIGIRIITAVVARYFAPEEEALRIWMYGLFATALMPILHRYFPSAHVFDYLTVAMLLGCTLHFLRNDFDLLCLGGILRNASAVTAILFVLYVGSYSINIIRQFQELAVSQKLGAFILLVCFSVLSWWTKSIIYIFAGRIQKRATNQRRERENQLEEILISTHSTSQSREAALGELKSSLTEAEQFRILKRVDTLSATDNSRNNNDLQSLKRDIFECIYSSRYLEEIASYFIDETLKAEAAKQLNSLKWVRSLSYKRQSWNIECNHENYDSWGRGTCSSCGGTELQNRCKDCGYEWNSHICN